MIELHFQSDLVSIELYKLHSEMTIVQHALPTDLLVHLVNLKNMFAELNTNKL